MATWTVPVGNVTAAQVTGLQPGSQYTLRIRAVDAAGNTSAWTSTVLAATTVTPAAVAATTSIPTPTVIVPGPTPATVAATTAIPTPAVGTVRTASTAGTSGQVTGLLAGRPYMARVRAQDAAGNWSPWSAFVPFSTIGVYGATVQATTSIPSPTVGGTPPTLTAGVARPVVAGATVGLDITAAPPSGQSITGYSWAVVSGAGSLTGASTATPTYTAPGSGSGLVTVRATVFTSGGGTGTADVTVSYGPNVVAAENALMGTARAGWDLASPNLGGISTLQGFCDGFSADKSSTVSFKIAQSDGAGWSAELFRLGYYAGTGARSYGTLTPASGQLTASQSQPAPGDCDPDTTLPSADCSAWATTLTWAPPAWAPSGIYILRLNRIGGGASHVMFVLRDDARTADLLFMPADSTWNAYNAWGGMGSGQYAGNSLYFGTLIDQYNADCAHYVSYDRPLINRGAADAGRSYGAVEWSTFFTGEYPALRFAERNGVDIKYYGCIDAAADVTGTFLLGGTGRGAVKAAMAVGHSEYWSDGMRAGWERAKNLGVSMFFCASNEVFWRLVGSNADGQGRPRVWECQKSTINGRGSGRPQWTGTWRDPDGAGKGGGFPENTLTGTIYCVNGPDLRSLVVPANGGCSAQPLWRHTTVAALTTGQSWTSPDQVLGFEWDTYGPAGLSSTGNAFMAAPHPKTRYCSDVTYNLSSQVLADAGDVYGAGNVTHRLVVHPGGGNSIVFGTGTINWALGLDPANFYQVGQDNSSQVIQQATINMLADMGAGAATLMPGLTQPTPVDWYPEPTPGTVAATTTIPAPTVTVSAVRTPVTVAAPATMPASAVTTGSRMVPATVTVIATVPTPVAATSATVNPATVTAVSAIPAPTVTAGSSSTTAPATVTAVASIPTPVVQAAGNTTVPPATVTAGTAVPAATVRADWISNPGTVQAVASVPQPTAGGATVVTLTTVAGVAAIAGPTVTAQTQHTATPMTVAAKTFVPVPIVYAKPLVLPGHYRAGSTRATLTGGSTRG